MRNWLKSIRKDAGLSQQAVAEAAGISQNFYSWIENGQRRPSPENAKKIASVLGFEWTRFFEEGGGVNGNT